MVCTFLCYRNGDGFNELNVDFPSLKGLGEPAGQIDDETFAEMMAEDTKLQAEGEANW